MLYFTHKLLNEEQINEFSNGLMSSGDWVDGKISNMGSPIKRNLQLDAQGDQYDKLAKSIINIVEKDPIIQNAVFPAKVHNILFSRTGGGMFYGPHIDSPHINSGRRDLSFTIFLNEKKDYEGGELIIEDINSENKCLNGSAKMGFDINLTQKRLKKERTMIQKAFCLEKFDIENMQFDHGEHVSSLCSATNGLGSTSGITVIGDNKKKKAATM